GHTLLARPTVRIHRPYHYHTAITQTKAMEKTGENTRKTHENAVHIYADNDPFLFNSFSESSNAILISASTFRSRFVRRRRISFLQSAQPPKPVLSSAEQARLGGLIVLDVGKQLAHSTALRACPELVERGRLSAGGPCN
ncbi:MAG: hypothetical protein AMJ65_18840, partial [Phycisphaerae bacterium SG8_4]